MNIHNHIYYCLNTIQRLMMLAVILASLYSCKKESVPPPSYQDAVYFYISAVNRNTSDTIAPFNGTYSFYYKFDSTAMLDTFWLPAIRIVGNTSTQDRAVKLVAIDSATTAVEGRDYTLLNNVIPADSFATSKAGIVLLRSKALADSSLRLTVQLQPSDAFPGPMIYNTLIEQTVFAGNTFTITYTNNAIEPPYWSSVSSYFYQWGRVKYEFMAKVLGKYLALTPVTAEEASHLFDYLVRVKQAFQEYNAANPDKPLVEDDGSSISF